MRNKIGYNLEKALVKSAQNIFRYLWEESSPIREESPVGMRKGGDEWIEPRLVSYKLVLKRVVALFKPTIGGSPSSSTSAHSKPTHN